MKKISLNQALHGYRDGHRQLQCSISLNSDATRELLILSDISGPSIQPGFEEYLTGYPLPGTSNFVIARTWYAPEMKRPGCVWTHSIFLTEEDFSLPGITSVLKFFKRPMGVEDSSYKEPIVMDIGSEPQPFSWPSQNKPMCEIVVEELYGKSKAVILQSESSSEFENLVLGLWFQLWPGAKRQFSFCTGALTPRHHCGGLMTLQVVPKSLPSSYFRKIVSSATIIGEQQQMFKALAPWVKVVVDDLYFENRENFREWLFSIVSPTEKWSKIPELASFFQTLREESPIQISEVLNSLFNISEIEKLTLGNLVTTLFRQVKEQVGCIGQRELLIGVSTEKFGEKNLLKETSFMLLKELFTEDRLEGIQLVAELLEGRLNSTGEDLLRSSFELLEIDDVITLGKINPDFFPTLIRINPKYALAPHLWENCQSRARAILSALYEGKINPEMAVNVVQVVLDAKVKGVAEELLLLGGENGVVNILNYLIYDSNQDLEQWKVSLRKYPESILKWAEERKNWKGAELNFLSYLLTPHDNQLFLRIENLWLMHLCRSKDEELNYRVAGFGLSIGLSEKGSSELVITCFQPVFDVLLKDNLPYDVWFWLQEKVPLTAWWREWDKCERVANAVAHRMASEEFSLENFFSTAQTPVAIEKIIAALNGDWKLRGYLKKLRKFCKANLNVGSNKQRQALLNDESWF